MAVTQISRIQHRRGLEQDLPQLAAAELGWSVDTRNLYIGNGTLEEGAPTVGVTRILTENDISIISEAATNFVNYTYYGNVAGYIAQTGTSTLTPVERTVQEKLDDFVNIRDFGAKGDGVTDDTSAINRALQQIYKSTYNPISSLSRRTIYFPGGTYLTTGPILIPPFARLIGDGSNSAIVSQSLGNQSVVQFCDSSFQTGASIGTASAVFPKNIDINGLGFTNSNTNVSSDIFVLDSSSNIKIQNSQFTSNTSSGYPNLVTILSSVSSNKSITFDNCIFANGGNAISIPGNSTFGVRAISCTFLNISNVAVKLNNLSSFLGLGNYFGSTVNREVDNAPNSYYQTFGSYNENNNIDGSPLRLGNLLISLSQEYTISTTPVVASVAANVPVMYDYTITTASAQRVGKLKVVPDSPTILFDDEYVETATAIDANITSNSNSMLFAVTSGSAKLKIIFKTFL